MPFRVVDRRPGIPNPVDATDVQIASLLRAPHRVMVLTMLWLARTLLRMSPLAPIDLSPRVEGRPG